MSKEIKHQVMICAPQARVFEALMDSRKHAAFTGERAALAAGGRRVALLRQLHYGDQSGD